LLRTADYLPGRNDAASVGGASRLERNIHNLFRRLDPMIWLILIQLSGKAAALHSCGRVTNRALRAFADLAGTRIARPISDLPESKFECVGGGLVLCISVMNDRVEHVLHVSYFLFNLLNHPAFLCLSVHRQHRHMPVTRGDTVDMTRSCRTFDSERLTCRHGAPATCIAFVIEKRRFKIACAHYSKASMQFTIIL